MYFLPELGSPANVVMGVRPAGRVPSHEAWRDWVYIESGYIWLIWTGGIPFALAYVFFAARGIKTTARIGRRRRDASGIAAIGAFASLVSGSVLMVLDPHLTMRGGADLTFALLALAGVSAASRWHVTTAERHVLTEART
jgi:hypothetical protein